MCPGPTLVGVEAGRAPEIWPEYQDQDAATPDNWVPRHPELVRLTGKHPFNVEPTLPLLKLHGHSTPASLHYTRNHGAVPIVAPTKDDRARIREAWRIKVHGEVVKERTFSIAEMGKLPGQRTAPALLVCAGNRRKEQNMVKRTIGFSWGCAGLGMSEWTGVYLADVLVAAGISNNPDDQNGLHVVFRGPLKELPAGEDGAYGTSLTLRYAMDRSNDVVVAWQQNGVDLQPDHGFPLRLIIPGYVGGRMVKWVEDFEISKKGSQNHYHFKDNRVMPVNVTPEEAEAEGWWYKPQYILNELNINSAIWAPAHDEVISLAPDADGRMPMYSVEGYAYSGGGREVIRVEVTLDDGISWHLVHDDDMSHPPNTPNAAGKYFGWVNWAIKLPLFDVARAKRVACRAWDNTMNTQPKNLTWNVMGMYNNPWFTIEVHSEGSTGLRFEHPTLAGTQEGGWMTPDAKLLPSGGMSESSLAALSLRTLYSARDDKKEKEVERLELTKDDPPPPPMKPLSVRSGSVGSLTELNEHGALTALAAAMGSLAPPPLRRKESVSRILDAQKAAPLREVTPLELASHSTDDDCWIAIEGVVYDATPYLAHHPGGAESITMTSGTDTTEDFSAIHSKKAWKMLTKYAVGTLVRMPAVEPVKKATFLKMDRRDDPLSMDVSSSGLSDSGMDASNSAREPGMDSSNSGITYAGEAPKPEKESWLFNTRKGSFSDIGRSFGAVFGASTGWDHDHGMADVEFTPEMAQKELDDADAMDASIYGSKSKIAPVTLQGPKVRIHLPLAKREMLSSDVVRLTYALPTPQHRLGLGVGLHVALFAPPPKTCAVKGEWNGRMDEEADDDEVERKYTPTSLDTHLGVLELVVKVYEPLAASVNNPHFADGGKMSQYLGAMKLGEELELSGPWGLHEYAGRGAWRTGKKRHTARHLGMLAGGTGITPMLQVIETILADSCVFSTRPSSGMPPFCKRD